MAKVTSFNLRRGTRIGQYEIVSKLGRGWEGEVYNVKEVPTDAPRAMKIVRHRKGASVRDYGHIGWYFEQLAETGAVARYYHMGQWFLEDNEGLFYFVFERLRGENLQVWLRKRRRRLGAREALGAAVAVASAIAKVHQKRVAVGDFEWGDNLIVLDDGATVKICDCNPGWADHANVDFKNDIREFRALLYRIFGPRRRHPLFRKALRILDRRARRQPVRRVLRDVHATLYALFEEEARDSN
jgi:hypothetical protein